MATIKSYSDLEQSKKLAEILPIESADNVIVSFGDRYGVKTVTMPKETLDVIRTPFADIRETTMCWSLAALLGVLPKNLDIGRPILAINYRGYYWVSYFDEYMKENFHLKKIYDNPIDACVDMIEHLHELKML